MAFFIQGSLVLVIRAIPSTDKHIDPNGRLLRDLWAYPEVTLACDNETTIVPLPADYESICNLLSLKPKATITDPRHPSDVMMHEPGSQRNGIAILRLQGFLKDPRLGKYGDWNGNPEHCMIALSSVYIEPPSSARTDIWRQVWSTLRYIRRWVSHTMNMECKDSQKFTDLDPIRCTRRVFARAESVGPFRDHAGSSVRHESEHPLDVAATQVKARWVTDPALSLGIRRADGRVTKGHPALFQSGDFVDIAISFEIAERRGKGFNLYLHLEHVVQLVSSDKTQAVCIRELRGLTQESPAANHQKITISFAEDEDSMDN